MPQQEIGFFQQAVKAMPFQDIDLIRGALGLMASGFIRPGFALANEVPQLPGSVSKNCYAKLEDERSANPSRAAEAIGIRIGHRIFRRPGECRRFTDGNDAAGDEISIRVAAGETNLAGPELVHGLA
jgi:hypothetical protein